MRTISDRLRLPIFNKAVLTTEIYMTQLDIRLWTVDEYHRMVAAGIISLEERVELIEGQIILKKAKSPPQTATNACTADYLGNMLLHKAFIRLQAPICLSLYSEPEPDVAVVRFDAQQYFQRSPTADDVFLVLDVADSYLQKDSFSTTSTYAKAGIADYWILDVSTRTIHVYRKPDAEAYQQKTVLDEEAIVSPLAFPEIKLHVNHLFP